MTTDKDRRLTDRDEIILRDLYVSGLVCTEQLPRFRDIPEDEQ